MLDTFVKASRAGSELPDPFGEVPFTEEEDSWGARSKRRTALNACASFRRFAISCAATDNYQHKKWICCLLPINDRQSGDVEND